MRSIPDVVRHFKQNWTEELAPQNMPEACRDCGMTWIESMLNPIVTVQIFFLQILNGNTACSDMPHLTRMSFTAAGYCKARMRISYRTLAGSDAHGNGNDHQNAYFANAYRRHVQCG